MNKLEDTGGPMLLATILALATCLKVDPKKFATVCKNEAKSGKYAKLFISEYERLMLEELKDMIPEKK